MKGVEAALLGVALLLVPALAWMFGRFAGRRDWSVAPILASAPIIGGGIYGLMVWIEALALPSRTQPVGWPEIPGFLIVFAGFLALIGWAGTPVAKRRRTTSKQ